MVPNRLARRFVPQLGIHGLGTAGVLKCPGPPCARMRLLHPIASASRPMRATSAGITLDDAASRAESMPP